MPEPNPGGIEYNVEDTVEDTVENAQGWHRSHADDHAGKFRFGHPDTAARRKPVIVTVIVTGQHAGDAKSHRRIDGQPLT